jgi:RNA polymerase sigma-70 factor (ECF subfamily)
MSEADERRASVLAALDEYEVLLVRYALRLVGDENLARDCVQHAFLKLCEESRNATEGVPYRADRAAAWLFRVCRNRAIDHLRQAGREQSVGWALPTENQKASGMVGTAHPTDPSPGPAKAIESRELAACLRELVEELPAAQREAIDLWCEGFAYREIGEITGHKEGHVRVLVHRGLTSVREDPQVRAWLEEDKGRPLTPSGSAARGTLLGELR